MSTHTNDGGRPESADDAGKAAIDADPGSDGSDEFASNTLLNGAIGGVVGVVLSAVTFSTIIGGMVAGYLEGGDYRDGAKVGAIAGVVALVPFVVVLTGVFLWTWLTSLTGMPLSFLLFCAVALLVGGVFIMGFSVVGGIFGSYVRAEIKKPAA